jgi:hypothetical protein
VKTTAKKKAAKKSAKAAPTSAATAAKRIDKLISGVSDWQGDLLAENGGARTSLILAITFT